MRPCKLFDLPPEVRHLIFKAVFEGSTIAWLYEGSHNGISRFRPAYPSARDPVDSLNAVPTPSQNNTNYIPSLLLVCKQMYEDAYPAYVKYTTSAVISGVENWFKITHEEANASRVLQQVKALDFIDDLVFDYLERASFPLLTQFPNLKKITYYGENTYGEDLDLIIEHDTPEAWKTIAQIVRENMVLTEEDSSAGPYCSDRQVERCFRLLPSQIRVECVWKHRHRVKCADWPPSDAEVFDIIIDMREGILRLGETYRDNNPEKKDYAAWEF